MREDRDGLHSTPLGASGRSSVGGKRRGRQSSLRRRARRTALLGPSRYIVRRDSASELLECGHTIGITPIVGSATALRAVYRRCRSCGDDPSVPGICGTCGAAADLPTAVRCAGCWEVERRLEDYLGSRRGRAFASQALEAAQARACDADVKLVPREEAAIVDRVCGSLR